MRKFFWALLALIIINLPQGLDSWSNLIQKFGAAQEKGLTGMPTVPTLVSTDWLRDVAIWCGYLIFTGIVTWDTRWGRMLRSKMPLVDRLTMVLTQEQRGMARAADLYLGVDPLASMLSVQEQQLHNYAHVLISEVHWALEAVNSHFVVVYPLVNASMLDFNLGASITGKIWINGVELKDPIGFRDAEVQPIYAGRRDSVALRQYLNQEEMQALTMPGTDVMIDLSWVKIQVQTTRPDKTPGPAFDLPIYKKLEAKAPSWLAS